MFSLLLLLVVSASSFLGGCFVAFSGMPPKEPMSLRRRLDRAAGACFLWSIGTGCMSLFAASAVGSLIAYLMGVVSALPLALTSLWLIVRGTTTRWSIREEQTGMVLATGGVVLAAWVYYLVIWPWVS